MGVTGELRLSSLKESPASPSAPAPDPVQAAEKPVDAAPAPEMEALLKSASANKTNNNADDFWNQAAEKVGNKPVNSEAISLEDARKLGIITG